MIHRVIRQARARTPLFDVAYYGVEWLTSLNGAAGDIFGAPLLR